MSILYAQTQGYAVPHTFTYITKWYIHIETCGAQANRLNRIKSSSISTYGEYIGVRKAVVGKTIY